MISTRTTQVNAVVVTTHSSNQVRAIAGRFPNDSRLRVFPSAEAAAGRCAVLAWQSGVVVDRMDLDAGRSVSPEALNRYAHILVVAPKSIH